MPKLTEGKLCWDECGLDESQMCLGCRNAHVLNNKVINRFSMGKKPCLAGCPTLFLAPKSL